MASVCFGSKSLAFYLIPYLFKYAVRFYVCRNSCLCSSRAADKPFFFCCCCWCIHWIWSPGLEFFLHTAVVVVLFPQFENGLFLKKKIFLLKQFSSEVMRLSIWFERIQTNQEVLTDRLIHDMMPLIQYKFRRIWHVLFFVLFCWFLFSVEILPFLLKIPLTHLFFIFHVFLLIDIYECRIHGCCNKMA